MHLTSLHFGVCITIDGMVLFFLRAKDPQSFPAHIRRGRTNSMLRRQAA